MLNPRELYEFFAKLSSQSQTVGETDLANELQVAMKHFVFPLTSEFYGVSMAALKRAVSSEPKMLSEEDTNRALIYIREIQEKWFRT